MMRHSSTRRPWILLLSGVMALASALTQAADLITGLELLLKLDNTSGTSITNDAPNGVTALLTNWDHSGPGGGPVWIPGAVTNALYFNTNTTQTAAPTNTYIRVPYNAAYLDFNARTQFTIAMWFYPDAPGGGAQPGGACLFDAGPRGTQEYTLDFYAGQMRLYLKDKTGTQFPVVSGSQLNPLGVTFANKRWYHVAAVWNGADPANASLVLYLNGVSNNAAPPGTVRSSLLQNGYDITFGSRNATKSGDPTYYDGPFQGALDDIRMYNRALSADDVQGLFNLRILPPPPPDSEFIALRLKWRDILTGGTNLDLGDADVIANLAALSAKAQSFWDTMNKAAGRTNLWSDWANPLGDSFALHYTYDRLRTLALAYSTPGSALYSNAALRADLLTALDWGNATFYNATRNMPSGQNWWHWQIGVPLRLNDITVLLYDTLSGAQITNYMNAVNKNTPAATGTAANLVWEATVVAVRGAIVKDSDGINSAVSALSPAANCVFPYVTSGDGFYRDGSFIQHSYYPYAGSYGSSLLVNLAPLLDMLQGSRWTVTDPNESNVFQWVYNTFEPAIYKGAIMDMMRGRCLGRQHETDHIIGQQTIASIIRLARVAPPADAAAFRSMAKYWMQADTSRGFITNTDLGTIPLAQAILRDPGIAPRGELVGHYHFGATDRTVHLASGYGFGISMFSSRIANFESFGGENLRGWYTGDGMTYLYNADLKQFNDAFWPTVNAYRLPGTTVDTMPRTSSGSAANGNAYRGIYKCVGGAALNGWGVSGMQLDAWNSDLTAKKSWFMFDSEIVCLGAGITCTSGRTIETIVENRMLTAGATNALTVDGVAEPTSLGWSETMASVGWAHLAGNVPGADIGYYFPQGTGLNGLREPRSGSWCDVDTGQDNTPDVYTRNYLTLWVNHGINPVNSAYAYMLLPGKSAAETGSYATNPQVEVLTNVPSLQAVRQGPLGVTAANFWNDDTQTVAGISVNRKASVVLQVTETNLALAVADPTQTNSTGITVTLNQPVTGALALDPGVSIVRITPTLQLSINTSGAAGKSFHASFGYVVTNFAAFQNVHFSPSQISNAALSGPAADPDHDGIVNAIEYALLLDPWQAGILDLQPRMENGRFTLTYPRRKLATDLTYTVAVSTDLLTWDTSGAQFDQAVIADTGNAQLIKVTEKTPAVSGTQRFFQLRVALH